MGTWLLPYSTHSNSAKALANELGIKRIKLKNSKFVPTMDKIILNWGNSVGVGDKDARYINSPKSVAKAANKLECLQILHGIVPTPAYTTCPIQARSWCDAGHIVVARTVLNGHSGEGIVVVKGEDKLPEAPLYTKYIRKRHEYRVHVMYDKRLGYHRTFDVQRKMRRWNTPPNWRIRSYANGFVFGREHVVLTERLAKYAEKAVHALDLTFGAVDLIYNESHDEYYVLEVNTAPGLEGTTLLKYANKLGDYLA